jgi:tetratricopeptide (TPR) repeat protein
MTTRTSSLVFLAVLAAAVLGVYLPGLHNGLVFDDARLTDGTIFGQYGGLSPRVRMLSYGSFVWVQALFGESWWLQRLVNVLLHLGVAAGLYALFRRLLERTEFPEDVRAQPGFEASRTAALRIGVALFALNPVAVYAVAYLVQRSSLMAALFVVLACIAWVEALQTRRPGWFAAAAVAYVLAVFSKETAVMAAGFAVPLYVFVQRPPLKRTLAVLGAAVLVVAIVGSVLAVVYRPLIGTVFDNASHAYVRQLEVLRPGVTSQLLPLSIMNQAALFFWYGFLWFFPNVQWMSIDLRPAFPTTLVAWPHALGALAYLATLAAATWLVLRRSDALGFLGLCLLWPALLFFSEFPFVWLQDPFVLYRSYLWALALPGLVALPLVGFPSRVLVPAGVVLAALFGVLAVERTLSFKDDFTVWSDAAEKIDVGARPNAVGRARPFVNRGGYFLQREMLEHAYQDFARAEQLGEAHGSALFNLGMTLQLMKKQQDAANAFALAERKGFAEPALYYHQGEALYALGRFQEAFDSYSKAVAKKPAEPIWTQARMRRAQAATAARRYDDAIADLKALLAEKPGDLKLTTDLGMTYIGKEDSRAALAVFDGLLAKQPSAGAYYGRALALWVGGDKARGLRELDQAIALDPANPMYKDMRARLAAAR